MTGDMRDAMDYTATLKTLESLPLAVAIARGDTLFPWIECVHVLAIALVVGLIVMIDLRLIGWPSQERPLDKLASELLPVIWGAFAAATICSSVALGRPNAMFSRIVPVKSSVS